jgi:hypothetical protein
MRGCLCLWVVLALGVLVPQVGWAENASRPAAGGKAGHSGTGTEAKGQTGKETDSANKGAAEHGANAGSQEPIDTVIPERPRVAPFNKKTTGTTTTRWKRLGVNGPSGPFQGHAPNVPPAGTGVVRNATGVPIHNQAGATATNGGRGAVLGVPSSFSRGVGTSTVGNAPKIGGAVTAPGFGHPNPSPIPGRTVGSTSRAGISGTGVSRPGYGPATIGGAAKNVTAINGTTVRPNR